MNQAPNIPDHEMICCAGRGSYGEVWLAKSVMGTFRGIKIVYRQTFDHDRPFEREFEGIQKFEPVSRTHPGLVSILQVGRNREAGYFYYVMEVADDLVSGTAINPQNYTPKNLNNTLGQQGKFPLPACLEIGLALTAALAHLHRQGLIHRDIKPSNIIFVKGAPKFADIGLVTEIGEATTFVGTQGYIAPEGPGSPAADLYSLGKVLYELSMGKDQDHFPELPTQVNEPTSIPELLQWNQIILRACETNVNQRFQSAEELHAALSALCSPPPVVGQASRLPSGDVVGQASRLPSGGVVGQASRLPTGRLASETQDSGMTPPPAGGTPAPLFQAPRTPGAASPHLDALQVSSPTVLNPAPKAMRVAILYKSNVQPDGRLLELLSTRLSQLNCHVFFDKHLAIGVEWAREIEKKIRDSDAAIVLLSTSSIQSEMIAYEVEIAHQAAQQQSGKPRLLPVRIQYRGPLPGPLAPLLDALQYFLWEGPNDDDRLVQELLRALDTSQKSVSPEARVKLESIGGAVPLESQFYVHRPTDQEFQAAIARRDSIVLVKGARQMGKTSLLARGLQQARQAGAKVVLTDFQKLNASHLASVDAFFRVLGDFLSDQLDLSVLPQDVWDPRRSPNTNFERFLRREVLGKISNHFVWGLDEVDRLFSCDFGSEVFGLFRSWHNERALDPSGPWSRLTMAIAYATEAHLFITDVNQSPFNVGTRLTLDDFNLDQVTDLNQRYGSPLRSREEIQSFAQLLGGQPYLVRRGFNELASGQMTFADLAAQADRDEGMFGDHLRRILVLLAKDPELCEVVRGVLRGQSCPNASSFYRLRSAGVMAGDSPQQIRPRCKIYETYLKRHLV